MATSIYCYYNYYLVSSFVSGRHSLSFDPRSVISDKINILPVPIHTNLERNMSILETAIVVTTAFYF